ncbi:uncharacterized protein SPPG_07273 [Spizellomyces punctatus DAOM BR117]|uniref:Retinol dehydrogenase 12 n=1 Tax=Spizellomyces punctatus (strain DAOM BR117) TaxID=645134 RepID=A0A0L0H747_SPIPD|nr:uncharacterized protein SPPG_07273 [Spizellomyces punctatus DAOM BR117]KNC97345.1 hypothetical protein SPPG_07273 [Spizellomyces punctatus DAOM BR117]|eukprot:XP_016605385.1 hypothetical protein SPPG_07273 [Spizellomyces punctatus DAOM BR117]
MSVLLEQAESLIATRTTYLPTSLRILSIGALETTYAALEGLFTSRKTAQRINDLTTANPGQGRGVIVTGGNAGIGYETAKALAGSGWKVVIGCRSTEKGQKAIQEIQKATGNEHVVFFSLDLGDLASVREFVDRVGDLGWGFSLLINNAGIMDIPYTLDNKQIEGHFSTNHLGHFLLTHLLLPNLKQNTPSRIVNLTSCAHYATNSISYSTVTSNPSSKQSPLGYYSHSKFANILFTKSLAQQLKSTGVVSYSVHPGIIPTDLYAQNKLNYSVMGLWKSLLPTPFDGCSTVLVAALDKKLEGDDTSGAYLAQGRLWKEASGANNEEEAKRLWNWSVDVCGIKC